MDSLLYQETLITFLFPFCADKFTMSNVILHQDNDPKHTSKLCVKTLQKIGIKWIKSPAKSPDLNPIELLWHAMLEFIRKKNCKKMMDIKLAILEWRQTITPEICNNYIKTIHDVIPIIIKNKGGWSNR